MSTVLRDAFSVTRFSFWTGLLLSSVVGTLAYVVTARSIESDAQQRFFNHARYAQNLIAVRINSYSNLLRGAASMLQSSGDTGNSSRQEFHEYVRKLNLSKNFAAVDTFNFAAYVTEEDRAQFERDLERDLQSFIGPSAKLRIQPPGIRPAYLIVNYVEPDFTHAEYYGIDLMSNRYLRDQLLKSRDEGKLITSARPIAALSSPYDIHLGMRLPVYRGTLRFDSVEQRRAAYIGSLGIAFSVTKLLHGVIDEMPVPGVRMVMADIGLDNGLGGGTSSTPRVVYDSLASARHARIPFDAGNDVFLVTLPFEFNGRPWQTTYSVPKKALHTEFDNYYPKLMMAFGFLGSILLYALLHTLTSSRRAALELAQEMTSELRESQSKLQLSHQKLRRLADHAYQIKELERKRIAREIHDDLGQNLLALRIEAEMLASRTRGTHSRLHARARATLQQIDTVIKSVRQIINDLRPTVLDLGLSAAVEWQVNQFQRRTGIACEVHDEHGEIALPDHCATAFFRILQESLTNIVRHANATKVVVELRLNAGWLSLMVKDNGVGLSPDGRNKFGSFGLVGIEERIVILGGTCAVFSEPEGGTTVMVSAPVDAPQLPPLEQVHLAGSAVV